MTMPFRLPRTRFVTGMVRARGNFDRFADRQAHADTETMSDQELLAQMRDHIEHPWRPPGGGNAGALAHDVIHGLDVTVAALRPGGQLLVDDMTPPFFADDNHERKTAEVRAAREELLAMVARRNEATDGTLLMPAEYLIAVAHKANGSPA